MNRNTICGDFDQIAHQTDWSSICLDINETNSSNLDLKNNSKKTEQTNGNKLNGFKKLLSFFFSFSVYFFFLLFYYYFIIIILNIYYFRRRRFNSFK